MQKFLRKHTDLIALAFFLILVFAFKFSIISTPFHWDEMDYDVPLSISALHNRLSPLTDFLSNRHPPLSFIPFALFFWIFGISATVARIPVLAASALTLFYTYKTGKLVYNELVGAISSVALFFMPIYFSQSGLSLGTTLMLPFGIASVYYYLKKSARGYAISSAALILIRETGILFAGILLFLWVYRDVKESRLGSQRKTKRENTRLKNNILLLCSPLIVFIAWIIFNKSVNGWWLYHADNVTFFGTSMRQFASILAARFYEFFISQYRFILSIALVAAIYFAKKNTALQSEFQSAALALIFLHIGFYAFLTNGFLPRYYVLLYPLLTLLAFGSVFSYFSNMKLGHSAFPVIGMLLVILPLFIISMHGTRTVPAGWMLESNMEYMDIVRTHQQADAFLEEYHSKNRILTCWPMTSELTYPEYGYVSSSLNVVDSGATESNPRNLNGIDVIYYSAQSDCYSLLEDASQDGFLLEKEFYLNGKLTRIYARA